jgi:hypothetical protein
LTVGLVGVKIASENIHYLLHTGTAVIGTAIVIIDVVRGNLPHAISTMGTTKLSTFAAISTK